MQPAVRPTYYAILLLLFMICHIIHILLFYIHMPFSILLYMLPSIHTYIISVHIIISLLLTPSIIIMIHIIMPCHALLLLRFLSCLLFSCPLLYYICLSLLTYRQRYATGDDDMLMPERCHALLRYASARDTCC